jgi:hypothetical protein
VDRALALDDRALGVLLGLLEVALDHREALDAGAVLAGQDLEDLALLALVGAGDDDDRVAAFDVEIFAWSENLRGERNDLHEVLRPQLAGDGPKMRVPFGLPSGPRMTMALLSKRR